MVLIIVASSVILIMAFVLIFSLTEILDGVFYNRYDVKRTKFSRKVLNGEITLDEYIAETNKLIKDEEMKKLNKIRKQKLNKLSNK